MVVSMTIPNLIKNSSIWLLVLLALAVCVLLPQIDTLKQSIKLLSDIEPAWAIAASAISFVTYLYAAATYKFLAFANLSYRQLILIQLTAMFVNRLVPGGIGALGVNIAFLMKHKHTGSQAAVVASVNNSWGFIGHALLLIIFFTFSKSTYPINYPALPPTLLYALSALVGLLLASFLFKRNKIGKFIKDAMAQLASYRHRKYNLLKALISSCGLTLTNLVVLYCCTQAVQLDLSLGVTFIILSLGVSLGAAVPTPGGLGGFEAGLVAGFVAYGVPGAAAIAAALLYRLITYWLAALIGGLVLIYVRKKRYI
jgi:glycosyltransferase 2 family protein